MSGTISSAQVRPVVEESPKITKIEDGSVSSHDLLRQELSAAVAEGVEPVDALPVETAPEPKKDEPYKPKSPSDEGPNFRSLRQKAEQAEREAREKEEIIQRLLRQQQQMPSSFPPKQEEYSDEVLERKHLTPLEQRIERLEKENSQLKQYTAADMSKREMRARYSDFEEVMSEDNLKDLEYMKPAVARALKTASDYEGATEIAYQMIKSLGIHQPQAQSSYTNNIEHDKKRIAENLAKAKPVNAIGKSSTPLGELSPYHREMTKERRDMLHNKVMAKMRRKKSF